MAHIGGVEQVLPFSVAVRLARLRICSVGEKKER